jgi:hypothetical protein
LHMFFSPTWFCIKTTQHGNTHWARSNVFLASCTCFCTYFSALHGSALNPGSTCSLFCSIYFLFCFPLSGFEL